MRGTLDDPFGIFRSLWRHRELVWQLAKREVVGRYRGSVLGLLWSFVHPLLTLAIYTFFFGVVFRARWGHGVDDHTEFALVLFAGLIPYTLFAECIVRAPLLVVSNPSYVKKVVFPLEILPWVATGSALFHAVVSFAVLLVAELGHSAHLPWTVLTLPLVLVPFVVLTVAISWVLAASGVYLRDTSQTVGLLTMAALFLSPVFYPSSALPEPYRPLLWLNPLTFVIEQARGVIFWGDVPDWRGLALYAVASLACARLALAWFERTRPGFADVV